MSTALYNMIPAVDWCNQYNKSLMTSHAESATITIGLYRNELPVIKKQLQIFKDDETARTFTYVERTLKTLLWIFGGNRILLDAPDALIAKLQSHYGNSPTGQFDSLTIGENIFGSPITVEHAAEEEIAPPKTGGQNVGRHLDGCRIGFDLGGSDRKCAALIDGKIVFSEEIPWNPYFEKNPDYHFQGIMDSLQRAAKHLPRLDAIGGSAAGVYVNNEVRVSSLFRGVSKNDFEKSVRRIFDRVKQEWNNVPMTVLNDGEVTALAGAMTLDADSLLGISMGTSTAAGYVTPQGHLTHWLNELAFVPVDFAENAPADEWSGDIGCAVQYFSQQGVARLAHDAGLTFPPNTPLAEQLIAVQEKMATEDPIAKNIYQAIGRAFGHTLAYWCQFYDMQHVLILGRVTSGEGGNLILDEAQHCLKTNYPEKADLQFHIPDEKMKRHGQAIAAASLPAI